MIFCAHICTPVMVSATTTMDMCASMFTESTLFLNKICRGHLHILSQTMFKTVWMTTLAILSLFDPLKGMKIKINWCCSHLLHADHTIQLNTFNSLIRELQQQVTPQNTGVLPYIKHINALLQQAVTTCKAAQNTDLPSQKQSLPIKESIPPGKNCDHQWRFKQTSKTPGRKKNGLILRLAVLIHKYAQLFESTPTPPPPWYF